MHPADIIADIKKRNSSQSEIAKKLGVSVTAVSNVIHNKGRSENIATYISGFIQVPLDKLWPGVYVKQFSHNMRAA